MAVLQNCSECTGNTQIIFDLQRGNKYKLEVCQECKERLEKKGWKVVVTGCHFRMCLR